MCARSNAPPVHASFINFHPRDGISRQFVRTVGASEVIFFGDLYIIFVWGEGVDSFQIRARECRCFNFLFECIINKIRFIFFYFFDEF